jgi:hypothetical protein
MKLIATWTVVLAMGASALAACTGVMLQTRDRDRDQLKDGSCQTAKLQTRDRDRLRDGSCQTARLQTRDRDRDQLKDGSCTV